MERHPLAEARGESVQAPTTNLPSNDPWRDEESPQTPKTPRLVLECEKPRSAQGHAGKHREKDRRSRWRAKPDATTKTATPLHHGPPRTRQPRTPDLDTPTWQTGKTPARHPHHACSGNAGACQTGPRTRMGSAVCTTQLWMQTGTLMPRCDPTHL